MSTNDSSKTPSNNQIVPFDFEGSQLRVIRDDNGDPWFVAADVCQALELTNVSQALSRVDSDDKSDIILNDAIGRQQSMAIINEPGLYTLVLSSRKSDAKRFKHWVTHDVLPSIRKTGQYSVTQNQDPILAMLDGIRETRLAQIALEQRVNQIEARQDAVDTELHHFTIIGYFRTRGKPAPDLNTAQTIGKKASALSRQLGYSIGKTTDPRFGQVSTYHEMILQQVLNW